MLWRRRRLATQMERPLISLRLSNYRHSARRTEGQQSAPSSCKAVQSAILSASPHFSRSQKTSVQFDLLITPDPEEPIAGDATWNAVFGPSGVFMTNGLTLMVDPTDSTMATLTVADDNREKLSRMELSIVHWRDHCPAGRSWSCRDQLVPNLVGISLQLEQHDGNRRRHSLTFQIWGNYDNGMSAHLFRPSEQPAQYSTSNASVVSIADISLPRQVSVRPRSQVALVGSPHSHQCRSHLCRLLSRSLR